MVDVVHLSSINETRKTSLTAVLLSTHFHFRQTLSLRSLIKKRSLPLFSPDGPAMNARPLHPSFPTPSSSASPLLRPSSNPVPLSHGLTYKWPSPPPLTSSAIITSFPRSNTSLCSSATHVDPLTVTSSSPVSSSQEERLLALLRQGKTEAAWVTYTQCGNLPSPVCLSRLVSQLCYQDTSSGLTRAQSIVTRLRREQQLHRLDANSLDLLAVAAAKAGHTLYASSIVKYLLRSGHLPHVKAWSAAVSSLAGSGDDGPVEALQLFASVTKQVRKFRDPDLFPNSLPDTGAYNAALNACANLGDSKKFLILFDEMSEFGLVPDALTYNVMIKLCARRGRKDLLVFVLERILELKIPFCMTTLYSLVAAFVGFNDLETAEKMVQAMREKRRDLCKLLKELKSKNVRQNDQDIFEKLLPNSAESSEKEPPLLPRPYTPDSRVYNTLMKGYMKAGRVSDTVQMLEAMRHLVDHSSRPDNVSYTTVVSALVKAGSMGRARQILVEMSRIGIPANRVTYNIILKGYCEQLQIDKAKELLREMICEANIKPDVVSYNILINGCILVDDSAGALAFFNEMRAKGIAPTKISYSILMKAFALSGQPKLAQKVLDEMLNDPRVKADLTAWNILVEGYCRLGLVVEAKKVIENMKEKGFYPNVTTYSSLAYGISLARKPGEALLLWKEVKERCYLKKEGSGDESPIPPLEPSEVLLDTLADICVRAAFFQKALEIVACMEENGISPNKTKFTRIYVEMHSRMFTSKHASQARQDRRRDRKRAAEAFKFWLGLPNSYYGSEWRLEPMKGYE